MFSKNPCECDNLRTRGGCRIFQIHTTGVYFIKSYAQLYYFKLLFDRHQPPQT